MFGYSREEAIGKPINDLVASEEFKEHAAANSYMVTHGQRTDNDSKRKHKDGTLFDVWIIGAPIIHDGKQMGVYAIYRDITERKKTPCAIPTPDMIYRSFFLREENRSHWKPGELPWA
jgi:PAS domain S-box-containing protein